jgi:SAM-dependent methyltransferase
MICFARLPKDSGCPRLTSLSFDRFPDNADVKIMLLVGGTMPRVFKHETTMIEHMRTSGLLDEYYVHGFGTMQSSQWLGNAVKEITDRHPHLHILEVGAGTGGATKKILKAIGHDLDSYTFTDISSSFFENAAEIFASWTDRMVFKVYDLERDPAPQGFKQGQYDVIVASLVIHATAELSKTLQNLRKLLRPGGYLVVGEGTSDGPLQSGDGFIFGALPGWWLGVDEGRTLSPFVNVHQWDDLLKRTGFSGIDTLAPPKFLETFGIVLFVSQAVDERIALLRNPLAAKPTGADTRIPKLAFIGGASEHVAELAYNVGSALVGFASEQFFYKSLEEVDFSIVDEECTVVSLVELDAPCFRDMTPETWQAFKRMFGAAKKLLWITTGRLADLPWSNMVVGFGRTAANETPGLHVQFLDLDAATTNSVRTISESLLRLHVTGVGAEGCGEEILWTPEPEIVVNSEGRHLVPRLERISEANDRYNSIQRRITQDVDLVTSVLELKRSSTGWKVTHPPDVENLEHKKSGKILKLRTDLTVFSAFKTDSRHQFLASCSDANGNHYLVFVPRTLTAVEVPKECAVPYNIDGLNLSSVDLISAVSAHLIALNITDHLFPGQKILLHNAPSLIASAVRIEAAKKDVTVFCSTDLVNDLSAPRSWTRIPAYTSRSELFELLPRNIACFIGFSTKEFGTEDAIVSVLPPQCFCDTTRTI